MSFCTECGHKNTDGQRFCGECGKEVGGQVAGNLDKPQKTLTEVLDIKKNQVIPEINADTQNGLPMARKKRRVFILASVAIIVSIILLLSAFFFNGAKFMSTDEDSLKHRATEYLALNASIAGTSDAAEIPKLTEKLMQYMPMTADLLELQARVQMRGSKRKVRSENKYQITSVVLNDAKDRGVVSYHAEIKTPNGERQFDRQTNWIKVNGQWFRNMTAAEWENSWVPDWYETEDKTTVSQSQKNKTTSTQAVTKKPGNITYKVNYCFDPGINKLTVIGTNNITLLVGDQLILHQDGSNKTVSLVCNPTSDYTKIFRAINTTSQKGDITLVANAAGKNSVRLSSVPHFAPAATELYVTVAEQ